MSPGLAVLGFFGGFGAVFYFWMGFCLYPMAIMDKGIGGLAGLKESWRMTNGKKGTIFVTHLLFIIMIIGILIVVQIWSSIEPFTGGLVQIGLMLIFSIVFGGALAFIYDRLSQSQQAFANARYGAPDQGQGYYPGPDQGGYGPPQGYPQGQQQYPPQGQQQQYPPQGQQQQYPPQGQQQQYPPQGQQQQYPTGDFFSASL